MENSLCDQSWGRKPFETKVGGVRDSDRRLVAYHIYFPGHPHRSMQTRTRLGPLAPVTGSFGTPILVF